MMLIPAHRASDWFSLAPHFFDFSKETPEPGYTLLLNQETKTFTLSGQYSEVPNIPKLKREMQTLHATLGADFKEKAAEIVRKYTDSRFIPSKPTTVGD